MNFYTKYLELCAAAGKSASAVSVEIGLSRSAATRWKNGSIPRDVILMKLAKYFGITYEEIRDLGK